MASEFIIDLSLSPQNGDFMEEDDELCNLNLRDSDEDEDLKSAQLSPARISTEASSAEEMYFQEFHEAGNEKEERAKRSVEGALRKQRSSLPSRSSPTLLPSLITWDDRGGSRNDNDCERGCDKRPLASDESSAFAPRAHEGRAGISIVGKSPSPSSSASPTPSSRLSPSPGPRRQPHQCSKLDIEHMTTKDNGAEQGTGRNEAHIRPSLGYGGKSYESYRKIIGKPRGNYTSNTNAEGAGQFFKNGRDIKRCYNEDRDMNYGDYDQMTKPGFAGLFTKRYKSQDNISGDVIGNNLFQPWLKREPRHRDGNDGAMSHLNCRMLGSSPNVGQNASSMDSSQISANFLDPLMFPFLQHRAPHEFRFDRQPIISALGLHSDMDPLTPQQHSSSLFSCPIPPAPADIPPNVLIQFAVQEIDSLSEQLLRERRMHQQTLKQVQLLLIEGEGLKKQLEYAQTDLRTLQLEAQVQARTQTRMHQQHQTHRRVRLT
ncbi:hypothetical protein EDD21DRAFT_416051 [Dissophora ornata]|nr:hypothetical protein BGZ58_007303 [Dissophora ornata]KAI8600237.1 hypothetical protein EDD21DRAFT_416051 [Dissophora ornata]